MQAHADDLRSEIAKDSTSLVDPPGGAAPDAAALDALVHQVVRDWRRCPFAARLTALLEFAERVTRAPATLTSEHVEGLRAAGWSDVAIHDATQVVAYFNYINRVADALGVEPEPAAGVWGA